MRRKSIYASVLAARQPCVMEKATVIHNKVFLGHANYDYLIYTAQHSTL